MSVVSGLRRSGLSRLGLLALIVLAYLVYIVGRLLEVGLGRLVTDFPVVDVVGSTAGLIVGLLFVQWFFQTDQAGTEEDADDPDDE